MTELDVREVVDDELGTWSMYARPCHPALRRFVGSYQGYTQRVLSPGQHATAVTHMFPLVVTLEGRHSISPRDRDPTVVDSFLAGIYRRPVSVEATAFRGVQVDLTPLGAFALLDGGAGELSEQTVSLDAVLGSRGEELVERIGNASNWTERLEETERILLTWFEEASDPSPGVVAAWHSIVAGQGRRPIEDIAAESGWSRHHLGRAMRRELGIPPKQLSRMVRFRHALDMVRSSRLSLAQIAVTAGYYDQAHMSSEFQEFTGRSPGSFKHRR